MAAEESSSQMVSENKHSPSQAKVDGEPQQASNRATGKQPTQGKVDGEPQQASNRAIGKQPSQGKVDGEPQLSSLRNRLSRILPESVVSFTFAAGRVTSTVVGHVFHVSRMALWVLASSSLILLGPMVLEVERTHLEERARRRNQRPLLGPANSSLDLGPNVALSSSH